MVLFWSSYMLLVFGMFMWLAEHPLSVGALILFLYMVGSLMVGFSVSFVVGVFLFLTGVSGMMVAFLYVVALCPNPVFSDRDGETTYGQVVFVLSIVSVFFPLFMIFVGSSASMPVEMVSLWESVQWLRDPCMCAGLSDLMPFLGLLLFLCMVSVVMLCGQQKQSLGGHGFWSSKRSYV
uniref:NADH dehydrogenase subunit 6 n=1 Tax=Iridona iridescens TaxID=465791 RepID=J3JR24_IRIIR|nr:NADH dehydrogenase subunit 6 [Iridona iridescens]AEV94275.1 NADH dehydrogenase subunit 6 [Iridona iridescens]